MLFGTKSRTTIIWIHPLQMMYAPTIIVVINSRFPWEISDTQQFSSTSISIDRFRAIPAEEIHGNSCGRKGLGETTKCSLHNEAHQPPADSVFPEWHARNLI
ncbi:hypothetical protein CUC15_14290 [Oceanobacillus zhaokaii]|uniref:Uncharacterized protein n=1 Tax=Oceanobacillus zhaokaii TaxID=2052660 RepID=A0A345PJ44_9BACI|nr:hypothetical protein CUC15_14290 [Oceanobacillus zhaokaii]